MFVVFILWVSYVFFFVLFIIRGGFVGDLDILGFEIALVWVFVILMLWLFALCVRFVLFCFYVGFWFVF